MGGVAASNKLGTGAYPAVDPRVLETLETNIGHEMVARLVALFHEAAARRISLLAEACAAEDYGALRRIAHDFVSDGASLGAMGLSDLARRIEAQALAGEHAVFEAARALEPLAEAARAALAAHISELK